MLDTRPQVVYVYPIMKRTNIYEKDRMDPHVPYSVPQSYYDKIAGEVARYPAAARFHCWRNEKASGVPPTIIVKGSEQEKKARQEAADWLAAGR